MIQSAELLVHYGLEKDIVLSCDASPYGVGAVLSHHMADRTERPIGNAAEKNIHNWTRKDWQSYLK